MRRAGALAALLLALAVSDATAQNAPRPLSLQEALEIGARTSESVGIARAGIDRARGLQRQARSERFPQLSGVASYTRTLRSQFSGFAGDSAGGPPPEECRTFTADPTLPLEERIDSLESALECSANANPFAAFADLPFGQANQYNLGLQASQLLFAGGRVRAQGRIADAGRRAAEVELDAQEAQLRLDVASAYYDAVLSDRLVTIAESTLVQTERTLENTRLARQVGNVAEFELLRAQVTRDNARPPVIQRRAQRDIAYLRLKQLLELPLEDSLLLTSSLDEPTAGDSLAAAVPDAERAAVRQAEANLDAQEGRLAVARAASLPTVRVASQFARLGYPDDVLPAWSDFVSDWNVSLSVSLPLFTGGRLSGERLAARADADEARLRLAQTRELAALDTRTAAATLAAAEAAYAASAGTVEQAERAYAIAEIRQQEGISTQTELGDSRIQLEQARANRAQSARDLQVARMRVGLIRDLPLGQGLGVRD